MADFMRNGLKEPNKKYDCGGDFHRNEFRIDQKVMEIEALFALTGSSGKGRFLHTFSYSPGE